MTNQQKAGEIWAILQEIAKQQQATQRQIDANTQGLAETRQLIESNARAIKANEIAIAEFRREGIEFRAQLHEKFATLAEMIASLGNQITKQFEQERTERAMLAEETRSLIEALRDRFGSNGH